METDIASLNKLTVPQLKNELRNRGLPLGGVKADLVSRLHVSLCKLQTQNHSQHPPHLLLPNSGILSIQTSFVNSQQVIQLSPPKITVKSVNLNLGLVDPRESHGSLVNESVGGDFDKITHEGLEWGFYCTKSMDYQVWTTVYLKCLKKCKEGNEKKRLLDEQIPVVEATVEFQGGKKMRGVLCKNNEHRFYVIWNVGPEALMKRFGARDKNTITGVKVTLRTLNENEVRQVEQTQKKQKHDQNNNSIQDETHKMENETFRVDWGVYDQLDSDDESRSEYYTSSEYSDDELD